MATEKCSLAFVFWTLVGKLVFRGDGFIHQLACILGLGPARISADRLRHCDRYAYLAGNIVRLG